MRGLFLGSLLFFAFYGASAAQSIFLPFKGQRELKKVKNMKTDLSRVGKPCGDYFTYEAVRDQRVLSFEVSLPAEEERTAVLSFYRLDLRLIRFKTDDGAKIPTAEFSSPLGGTMAGRPQLIVRISKNDYKAANCLPKSM